MISIAKDYSMSSFLQEYLAQAIALIERHGANQHATVENLREQMREWMYNTSTPAQFQPFLLQSCHIIPNLCQETLNRYLQAHGLAPASFLSGVAPYFDCALVPVQNSTAGSGYVLYLRDGLSADEIAFLLSHACGHLALGHLRKNDAHSHYDVLGDLRSPAGPQRRWDRIVHKYISLWYRPLTGLSAFPAIDWHIAGFAEAFECLQKQDVDDIGWLIQSFARHHAQKFPLVDFNLGDADLFPHQKRGAAELVVRLQKLGGALLADSVGLGKTRTVAATIKLLKMQKAIKQAAVLTPHKLRHNWQAELQKLSLKIGDPGNVDADVIIINKDMFKRQTIVEARQMVHSCQLLVIEEAHQDMRNMKNKFHYNIRAAAFDKYGILVTATPWNNRRGDIFALLQPFLSNRLGTERPTSILQCFSMALKAGQQLFEQDSDVFHQIYAYTTLQRTRRQLRESGDAQVFYAARRPHLVNIDYSSEHRQAFASLLHKVEQLRLPAYDSIRYLASNNTIEGNLSGFHRFRLLKRAESSMYAFALSLNTLEEQARKLYNKLLAIPDSDIAMANWLHEKYRLVRKKSDEDTSEEDIVPSSHSNKIRDGHIQKIIDLEKKRAGRLRDVRQKILQDCLYDITLIGDIRQKFQPIFNKDPKMEIIVEFIRKHLEAGQKVLCISQYVDTAFALYRHVLRHPFFLQRDIGLVTSSARADQEPVQLNGQPATRETVLSRFAPISWGNDELALQKQQQYICDLPEQIDILIGSDTLSVGQNLQDAQVLLNLDLCWNPMQHEQRIGRIDRPRHSQHALPLDIYYFLNLDLVEAELQLRTTLERRLAGTYRDTAFDDEIFPNYFEMIEKFKKLRQELQTHCTYTVEADYILEQITEQSATPPNLPRINVEQEQEAILQLQEIAASVRLLPDELPPVTHVLVNIGRVPWQDMYGKMRPDIPIAALLAEVQFQFLNDRLEEVEQPHYHTFSVYLDAKQEASETNFRLRIETDALPFIVDGLRAEASTIFLSHEHIGYLGAMLQSLENSIRENLASQKASFKRSQRRLSMALAYSPQHTSHLQEDLATTVSARLLSIRLLI